MKIKIYNLILVLFLVTSSVLASNARYISTNKIKALGKLNLQIHEKDQIVSLSSSGGRPIVLMNIRNVKELMTGRNNYIKIEVFKMIKGELNFMGSFTYTVRPIDTQKVISVPLPEFLNQSETYQFHVYDTNNNLNSKFSYSFFADDLVRSNPGDKGLPPDGIDPSVSESLIETVLRNLSVRTISSSNRPSIEKYGKKFILNIPDGVRVKGAGTPLTTSVLKVNAFGSIKQRSFYDRTKPGFVYLDNNTKQAYIKGPGVAAWSNPIPFTNNNSLDADDFEKLLDEVIPILKIKGGSEISNNIQKLLDDSNLFKNKFTSLDNKISLIDSDIVNLSNKSNTALDIAKEANDKSDILISQVVSINNILPDKLNKDFSNFSGDLSINGKIKTSFTSDKTISINLERALKEGGTLFGRVANNTVPVLRFVTFDSSASWTFSKPNDIVKNNLDNDIFKIKLLWSPNNNLAQDVTWELRYFSYNIGDIISDQNVSILTKTVTAPNADLALSLLEFEIPAKDFKDVLVVKLIRKDSNNIQPNLMAFELNYQALSLDQL